LKDGRWNKYGNNGRNLTGKKVGIIGVGNIGKDLVSLLQPFNCKILGNDIREDTEQLNFYKRNGVIKASKDAIYEFSDIISLHVPLTDLTRNLINEKVFPVMSPNSFLINTCRGDVVNEADLLYALKSKKIAGAALDVYSNEENPNFYKTPFHEELFSLPNVIPTPHMGGTSQEASLALGMTAIKNLRDYFSK
jgi:D-3-phosphoglycerate dehydrogenase